MVRKLYFLTALMFFFGARMVLCAFAFEPFSGQVTEDNINVRADSTVMAAPICNLNKSDQVEVVAQLYDWYKIHLPKNAPSFIKKNLLVNIDERTAKVVNDRVNIRLTPDKSAPIVGHVDKNEVVNIIADEGEWARIAPVNNSFGWVHKKFIVKAVLPVKPAADPVAKTMPAVSPDSSPVVPVPVKSLDELRVEGYVQSYGKVIKRQATHKIISSDNKVFLLKGNWENLNSLTYHKARVTGKLIVDLGSKYPVIEVSKMEILE